MDFSLNEEQEAIFAMAREIATSKIAPNALNWEQEEEIPRPFLKELGELGMAALYVGEDYGSNLSRLDASLVFEGLSYGCASTAAFLSIHNMCAWMVDAFGSETLKKAYLAELCSGEKICSYCLTEPDSGSDAAALKTTARLDGKHYCLNGTKAFISGAGFSDFYLVMARTGGEGPKGISCFLVEKDIIGLSFGANEKKMGWKNQQTAEVVFENCLVPKENLIGEEGKGFSYAMQGLDGGRLNISACSLGAAQAAFDKALNYMGERQAFGKKLQDFQALQFKLADMEINLQAAKTLLRHAAWHYDIGSDKATHFCAIAKKFITEKAFYIANEALQLHGGYGYLSDFGLEKIVRDLRVHQILEGTNEIMQLIISRKLLKR